MYIRIKSEGEKLSGQFFVKHASRASNVFARFARHIFIYLYI